MRKSRVTYCLVLLMLLGFTCSLLAQETEALIVNIHGAKANTGQVMLSLFTSKDNFLKTPILGRVKKVDAKGKAVFLIEGLDVGRYAISVFYDENNNNKLDTGFLGIPKEKVGFSNNAKGRFGPPKFEKVVFNLTEKRTLNIYLGKAKD